MSRAAAGDGRSGSRERAMKVPMAVGLPPTVFRIYRTPSGWLRNPYFHSFEGMFSASLKIFYGSGAFTVSNQTAFFYENLYFDGYFAGRRLLEMLEGAFYYCEHTRIMPHLFYKKMQHMKDVALTYARANASFIKNTLMILQLYFFLLACRPCQNLKQHVLLNNGIKYTLAL